MKTIILKPVFFLFFFLFFLNSNAQYTKLLDFAGTTNGSYPRGSLISDGTSLYGMTPNGGTNGIGTLFKIMPNGTGYAKLLDFAGATNGRNPRGSLIYDGTSLYGTTFTGGTNNMGTLFKIMPDGTGYAKLLDFAGATNGSYPYGSLIYDGTSLYGMTEDGGTNNRGTLFKIMTDGTGYAKLLDFDGATNGSYPKGSLIYDGTSLYGMTYTGGTNDMGTLFKIMPDGTGYAKLLDFVGTTNGSRPQGSLIYDGTSLYGTTYAGGTNNSGTLFKIMPNGTGYAKLLDFAGATNGSSPYGSLIYDGTSLYGMTLYGGTNNMGTLFKIMPNGTGYAKLLDFAGATNGRNPYGSLIYDGTSLYGMTDAGGTNDWGTLFKYQLSALSVADYNNTIRFSVYPNPVKDILTIQNPENHPIDKIIITDLTGKKVLEQKPISNTVNVEQLQNGMYLLEMTSEGKNLVTKFIKN
jgi:uncharacterized repeat protein (TIGR03803 family)